MELARNNEVFFDSISHTYLLGDKVLMGVTSLMKKHKLSPSYAGIDKETLDRAAAEGSAIHKEIEDYDNGLAVLVSPLIQEYQELNLKFVANEYLVTDGETIASFIDGIYEGSSPNKVRLCDYKSTVEVHRRALAWQLGIYKYFFVRQNPQIEVEDTFCLHIDKKLRKIKGIIPINAVTESEVEALLLAEKEGRIYVDEYTEPSASLVLSEQELVAYVENQSRIAELKLAIKEIEEIIKTYDKRILAYMQQNNLEKMDADGGTISIKKAYTRETVDTAKLKAKRPDIYDQFIKETKVAASIVYKKSKEK